MNTLKAGKYRIWQPVNQVSLFLRNFCRRSESNRHALWGRLILSQLRLPFRHFGITGFPFYTIGEIYLAGLSRRLWSRKDFLHQISWS